MTQSTIQSPSPGRLRKGLLCGCTVLGVVLLTILMFSPANDVMRAELDSSNYGSYSYFTAKNYQYGAEVIPMAGPYGFVPYGSTYSGQLFWKRLFVELATKLAFAGLLVWFFARTKGRWILRIIWLLAVVLRAPLINDLPYTLAIMLSGLCLAENHLVPGRRGLAVCCGLAAYLALLTLFKGTQTMLAVATFVLLFMQAVMTRSFRRLPWILVSYVVALALFLLIAGQNPLNFPRYLHGVMDLSAGYNFAMGLDEAMPVFLTGLSTLLVIEVIILLGLLPSWRHPVSLAGGLFMAGFSFVLWKHGFVRADGHVYIFFQYACIAVPTAMLFINHAPPGKTSYWIRIPSALLMIVALYLGYWGDGKEPWGRHLWDFGRLPVRFGESWQQLTAPAKAKAELNRAITKEREVFQLPRFQKLAGNSPIDFFGNEQGYLMLNRFNYRPRPMGGGTFNVFTPWLHDINVACLLDPTRRPEYFLVNVDTIDNRFTAQDDAGTLRALIANYAPMESGNGMTLFRTRTDAPQLPEPQLVSTLPFSWDAPVIVPEKRPDQLLLVSLNVPLNLTGRIRALLYKTPLVFMDLKGSGINQANDKRIIPEMFHYPVIISPVLEDTKDLLDLYQQNGGKPVAEFTLKTPHPECYDVAHMTVSFYTLPRPEPAPAVATYLEHSLVTKVEPVQIEAAYSPMHREKDLVAQIIVPPGRIVFDLQGDETQVRFTYGMPPLAYDRPSDGFDVKVELVRPGQAPQRIFLHNLWARTRPYDRGKHPVRLPLPPFPPGSKLYLSVGMGQDNDGAWDLAYFTDISFDHGLFIKAQFPGFATLPQAVVAESCGSLTKPDGKTVFMLNSPGTLDFLLTGNERKLEFSAGMLEGAYTNGGHSDGVEYQVEVKHPDGSIHGLFKYYLNPPGNPADRADRSFEINLPQLPPDSSLILRVAPGPNGDQGWDWSYISSLRLQ